MQPSGDLFDTFPFPLWQIDASASRDAALALRREGVDDVKAYVDAHPELVDHVFRSVVVERANGAAASLLAASDPAGLLRPVQYFFDVEPQVRSRLLLSRLGGLGCHMDKFTIARLDGTEIHVAFFVTFPGLDRPEDRALAIMYDVTERELPLEGGYPSGLAPPYAPPLPAQRVGGSRPIVHELAQPLSTMLTSAETGRKWLERNPPDHERAIIQLRRIIANAKRARDLLAALRRSLE
ncbi:hypothetical protein [Rhizobium sp. Leaf383]|uniref:hypothetical protein n=1 Tax=Rhizobium sp. Leaf383 TaxID=1736357 RepID=UPI000713E101|nr:hypothetical protein [Rhizobium sp. Leaf383]KQS76417.1 hypothetical protein ASG58_11375 [Rhizobium sp. Leaf383]